MTTKKQRREKVAERRAIYDAESRRMGLASLQMDHEKRQKRELEAERQRDDRRESTR